MHHIQICCENRFLTRSARAPHQTAATERTWPLSVCMFVHALSLSPSGLITVWQAREKCAPTSSRQLLCLRWQECCHPQPSAVHIFRLLGGVRLRMHTFNVYPYRAATLQSAPTVVAAAYMVGLSLAVEHRRGQSMSKFKNIHQSYWW